MNEPKNDILPVWYGPFVIFILLLAGLLIFKPGILGLKLSNIAPLILFLVTLPALVSYQISRHNGNGASWHPYFRFLTSHYIAALVFVIITFIIKLIYF